MDLTMMSPAQRNSELVADLAAECVALRKAQMVGIRGRRPQIRHGCRATDLT